MARSFEVYAEDMRSHNLTIQPHVIVVRNDSPLFYAYLDNDNIQRADTLLDAIDLVFKSCMLLNAAYSYEAKSVWTFIQKKCYSLNSAGKDYMCVKNLMSELE